MKSFTTSAALLLPAAQVAMAAFADDCVNFAKSFAYENTTVWFTNVEPAGANLTFPERHPTCSGTSQVVDVELCRVSMLVTTGATSNISLEAWLPSNWTGRFLSTGNGGTGGCIQYEDMAYATSRGFATVGANNGHNGTVGEPFYNNPGVIEDFAYRSLHTGVVVGKNVTKAFYGKEHTRSYYLGCSTGGRQGFKEAQEFPDDFDGIVAGAPAFSFNNLTSWSGHFLLATGTEGSPTFLSKDQWALVVKDVLTQCDGLDGHVDGIIEDPDLCQYRPESLICGAGNSTNCLTGTQAETVRSVFSDVYGVDGSLVYPRLQPGADATNILLTGTAFPYTRDWFRYVVYNDPNWDPATLTVKDMAYSSDLNPFDIATWKGDLSGVKDRGTKILHYHGLQDPIISSDNSARYYNHVSRTMGLTSAQLDEFYRYFRISGMNHCSGGPGATFIGNKPAAVAGYEAEGNVLSAIVHWVEDGIAPESILGTAYVNGTKDAGVAFTRKHCKYPTRNVYSGSGDPNIPESWNCV
ncbi:putative feruloyl esterase B-2 [Colletotrichum fructicola]|uniref:Carboxylic ester hydrolase n=1 Tax=Colletotrichum fructicola (strain Nara gc5) TaxID=1213859 RepID=A0A7J6J5V8_COLFN|nr:putative feruloyl esterase [Colletotrichum fructicola]KAF4483888.1 putative feruloyl esterase B-2 [Colletotrichum fructicola Nara gc5]KAI8292646.1 putative feruloyl esterase [Colletotrichum sp. SAR11_57]KAE9582314.1 putative feruloyl esterase [Colletotrichum fructicola]KAF4431237.1 putative feruloyl esterase B-2 [Colletotrichum fructicola]KAF4895972.1 putative feruloyl esterase B-2 [Colletotrichum fructicola]